MQSTTIVQHCNCPRCFYRPLAPGSVVEHAFGALQQFSNSSVGRMEFFATTTQTLLFKVPKVQVPGVYHTWYMYILYTVCRLETLWRCAKPKGAFLHTSPWGCNPSITQAPNWCTQSCFVEMECQTGCQHIAHGFSTTPHISLSIFRCMHAVITELKEARGGGNCCELGGVRCSVQPLLTFDVSFCFKSLPPFWFQPVFWERRDFHKSVFSSGVQTCLEELHRTGWRVRGPWPDRSPCSSCSLQNGQVSCNCSIFLSAAASASPKEGGCQWWLSMSKC